MKYKEQWECLDEDCKTVVVGHGYRVDGIRCPRCEGPVNPMPFRPKRKQPSKRAIFVRSKIIEQCEEHCFDLTPEQVDTVLKLGDEFVQKEVTLYADGEEIARTVLEFDC